MVTGLWSLEMLSEGLIDDLGDGQVIEVSLASDGLYPAPFDMEGGALGLAAGVVLLEQGGFALLPPSHEFCEVAHHTGKQVIVDRWYTLGRYIGSRGSIDMFLSGSGHGSSPLWI